MKFFKKTLTIELNGSIQESEAIQIWTSPLIDSRGYTLANVFASITVIEDSNPGTDFAIIGSMVSTHGCEGSPGLQTAIGQGIPIGQTPLKVFEGLGIEYRLPLMMVSVNPRLRQVLSGGVGFSLSALGVPQGRILRVNVAGVVVCGRSH